MTERWAGKACLHSLVHRCPDLGPGRHSGKKERDQGSQLRKIRSDHTATRPARKLRRTGTRRGGSLLACCILPYSPPATQAKKGTEKGAQPGRVLLVCGHAALFNVCFLENHSAFCQKTGFHTENPVLIPGGGRTVWWPCWMTIWYINPPSHYCSILYPPDNPFLFVWVLGTKTVASGISTLR